ncbi:DUF6994 family protein, partial [Salinibacter ruber]|uniref:DUF6994 family protein n=1 Tax=Salinibacter ruber TaxID=146919 RepID=UPI002072D0EA
MNQARGMHPAIADRIDLTLECVRRHYIGREPSPLSDVLEAYGDYFALFSGFEEFVDFFYLQDLVTVDRTAISFFLPFDGFGSPAVPLDVDQYVSYREATLAFASARGERMAASVQQSRP